MTGGGLGGTRRGAPHENIKYSGRVDERWEVYVYIAHLIINMFESHPRQSDCLGCAVLLCYVVCLTLLAPFFLPSHLSLKHNACTV